MEEVWEDITLPSLHNPTTNGGGTNLQDFFLNKNPIVHHYPLLYNNNTRQLSPADCPAPANTNTMLSLNSSGHPDHFPKSPKLLYLVTSKKRAPEYKEDDGDGDRRHKRLIKNRESADRSRARRQAYTTELEQEISELKKENEKLKGQLLKMGISEATAAAAVAPSGRKGNSLTRTLTAPF